MVPLEDALTFEREVAGASRGYRARAIRARFGCGEAVYTLWLHRLIDTPQALALDAATTLRLQRLREQQRRPRATRAFQPRLPAAPPARQEASTMHETTFAEHVETVPAERRFDGETYDPARDAKRLTGQALRVHDLMRDGRWRTLRAIADELQAPEASVSARLRDLRKPRFGGLHVHRRRTDRAGVYEYRLEVPAEVPA